MTTSDARARSSSRIGYDHAVNRRKASLIAVVACLVAACGIDILGTRDPLVVAGDSGVEASAIDGSIADSADEGFVLDGGLDFDGPVLPSNVDAALLVAEAGALVGPYRIDTTSVTIDYKQPPAGVSFQVLDGGAEGIAVLSVGAFVVSQEITVVGDRALIVLASGPIDVGARIRVDANRDIKGPGGFGAQLGPGAGGGGSGVAGARAGGGGGGHSTKGGAGGSAPPTAAGAGGAAYATALVGGSGGGNGHPPACFSAAGAGGGAIHLFSLSRIVISGSGGVHASGGGGLGSCATGSGAGGGAGGYILLEAPAIAVHGIVAANGGGGGGGDSFTFAFEGNEGPYGTNRADGGVGTQSTGGGGGALNVPPTAGGNAAAGAGGGGAAGLIHLHYRGTKLDRDGGVFSPATKDDPGL